MQELNKYHIMWVFVFFDLPTETKAERSIATKFRNNILKSGFAMFQYSIYIRHSASRENAQVYKNRVKAMIPDKGNIGILTITDKQFSDIEIYHSFKNHRSSNFTTYGGTQLELF